MPQTGRPKLPSNRTRNVFPIRISADERKLLTAAARKANQRLSEWARNQLLAAAEGGKP